MNPKSRANFINSVGQGASIPCPKCNKLNDKDCNYCVWCGTQLVNNDVIEQNVENIQKIEKNSNVSAVENVSDIEKKKTVSLHRMKKAFLQKGYQIGLLSLHKHLLGE